MPPPARRRRVIRARVLRPVDLVDLRVTVVHARLEPGKEHPTLVTGNRPGTLVVELAPQHLGEQAFPGSAGPSGAVKLAVHRAARGSRLVYELPAGLEIPWSIEGLLGALPTLRLKVVPLATPGPEHYAADDSPAAAPGGPFLPWPHPGPVVGPVITPAQRVHGSQQIRAAVTLASQARLLSGLARHGGTHLPIPLPPAGDIEPLRPRPAPRPEPRAPGPDETSLEVPYRLTVSPSAEHGAFLHDPSPVGPDEDRVELWHTRLTTRTVGEDGATVGHTEAGVQRVVRAVWSRDLEDPDSATKTDVSLMSLNPVDRRTLVRQTSATHEGVTPLPLRVDRLYLSALGAWVDWRGAWDTAEYGEPEGWAGKVTNVSSYRHQAQMGRDSYVRVSYPGFLFPFGHRCDWVKVTERKVEEQTRVAYLHQRYFIVLRETTRSWTERDTPLTQVTLSPSVSPDLGQPPSAPPPAPFFPDREGSPFAWDILGLDRAGEPVSLSAPLLFVPDAAVKDGSLGGTPQAIGQKVSASYAPRATIATRGQQVSFAVSAVHGDTQLEVNTLTWDGYCDTEEFTSRPYLKRSNAVVPALRHIAGQAPGVDLEFADAYLADEPAPSGSGADVVASDPGFGTVNPAGLFLILAGAPVSIDFGAATDRAGGFVAPNQMVRALSRPLGAVGDAGITAGGLMDGTFDPATFLEGALPKLFGLFSLVDLIKAVTGEELTLDDAPSFVTDTLDKISAIATQVQRLQQAITEARKRLQDDLVAADEMHQGAKDAIADAQAELESVAGALLTKLETLGQALTHLLDEPAAAQAAKDAAAALAGELESLRPVINHPRLPAALRSRLSKPLEALISLLSVMGDVLEAIDKFVDGILTAADGVSARFEWQPRIRSWPDPPPHAVFHAKDVDGFSLAVEVRASARSAPSVDISAELREFALVLVPGEPLMAMTFSRIGFRVGSNTKPDVDVVLGGMEFLGALGFVETLRRMIPFDGFSDPPYLDVAPSGVTAGFDLELPNVSVGIFSLENLSLGADTRVPFLGDAVTVGFNFCTKESPFRITVMCIGGGGWVSLRLSPMGMVALDMGLEAAASLSVNLGVASGSVSVSVGIYLRLEGEAGSLTGYFRIRGRVDVLGLISASITLELSLAYDFHTGKMVGRASVVVEIDIFFFSASVQVTCERQLAGSKGDPVLADIMPPGPDGHSEAWSDYCAAFAPGA